MSYGKGYQEKQSIGLFGGPTRGPPNNSEESSMKQINLSENDELYPEMTRWNLSYFVGTPDMYLHTFARSDEKAK